MSSAEDRRLLRMRESEFFDELVRAEGDFNPFADRGWDTLRARFQDFVSQDERVELLDVGCGTTQSRRLYRRSASPYVGVDLSLGPLRAARRRDAVVPLSCGDAVALPFCSSSFDVVCFSSVLHHILPGFEDALAEAFRVLRPGGRAFAFDPNLLHPAMALFRWPKSPLYTSEGVSPNERPLLASELRRAFSRAGFVDVRQRAQADIPFRAVAPRGFSPFLAAYNLADRALERSGLGRLVGTFIISTARKPA